MQLWQWRRVLLASHGHCFPEALDAPSSLTVLSTLLHVYMALRLVPPLAALTPAWPLLLLLLVVSAASMLPFIGLRSAREPLSDRWKWIGLLSMGWFSSMFVLTTVRDAGLVLAWGVSAVGGLSVRSARWDAWKEWSAAAVPCWRRRFRWSAFSTRAAPRS